MLSKLYLKVFKYTSLIILSIISLINLYFLTIMYGKILNSSLVNPKKLYPITFNLLITSVILNGFISTLTVSFELFLYQRTKKQRIIILLMLSLLIFVRSILGVVMLSNSEDFFRQAENSHQLFSRFNASNPLIQQIHNTFCDEIVTIVMLPLFLVSLIYSQLAIMRKGQKKKYRLLEQQNNVPRKHSSLSFYSDSCNSISNSMSSVRNSQL
ncbi:hypothetical protein ABPG72_013572 [Tetrahymena utriculariae]